MFLEVHMKRGLLLEQQFETFIAHRGIEVRHATIEEDQYQAIDLWVDGLAVQITLGRWQNKIDIARIRAKFNWTKVQSRGNALLVVFDCEEEICLNEMFRNALLGLAKIKMGAKASLVLVNRDNAQLLAGA
jgi:hypothetical protein